MSEPAMIILTTDIGDKIREIEQAYNRYLIEFRIPDDHRIVVNYSAGKDSTATLAVAHVLFGDRVQGVMADTDNEHEMTIEFGKNIHHQIGCKPVQFAKRIYTEDDFAKRRLISAKELAETSDDSNGSVPRYCDAVSGAFRYEIWTGMASYSRTLGNRV